MRAIHILRAQRAFFAAVRPLKLIVRSQLSDAVGTAPVRTPRSSHDSGSHTAMETPQLEGHILYCGRIDVHWPFQAFELGDSLFILELRGQLESGS